MWQKLLTLNQRMELEIEEGPYEGNYFCYLLSMEEDQLRLSVPLDKGQFVPVREGTRLKVVFAGKQALFQFSSRVVKRTGGNLPALVISPPEKLHRIQRREFFRLDVIMPLYLTLVGKEDEQYKQAITIDISGGGVKFRTEEEFEKDDLVLLRFDQEALQDLLIKARILRKSKKDDWLIYAAKFMDITENEQDQIIGFIFDKQREMKKKGLL